MIKKSFFAIFLLALTVLGNLTYADNLSNLFAYEKNIIKIFQNNSYRVVFITRLNKVASFMSKTHKIVPNGSGSGIIWNKTGYIVTNYHVVRNGEGIAVSLGKLTVPAKLVYADPRKDLAILRISNQTALNIIKDYPDVQTANTKKLLVGQTAIAIGNPYGLDHSLTVGVISALNRQVPGSYGVSINHMIQTDASINPGNSGGPLLDTSGKLIGINTAIFSRSGSSAGVGFAIPGDEVKNIVEQVVKNGKVKLPGIGVSPIDPKTTKRLGIERGVLIANILPNSPAAKAKLRATVKDKLGITHIGDIIVAIKGKPIYNYDNLYTELSSMGVGEEFTLTILRGNLQISHSMQTVDIADL